MARKSNKTAHVLNLLSGQDTGEEAEKEKEKEAEAEKEPAKKEPPAPSKTQPASAPSHEVPSNISIIDSAAKEGDPIAEQIKAELLKELGDEPQAVSDAPAPEQAAAQEEAADASISAAIPEPAAAAPTVPVEAAESAVSPAAPVTAAKPAASPAASVAVSEPAAAPATAAAPITAAEPAAVPAASPVAAEQSDAPAVPTPAPTADTAPASDAKDVVSESAPEAPEEELLELTPEPPAEPEPDYVMLNVMQRVVEDKIIYFMKQFEVCTCDRCKADTIALTLNGLPAKYRIVEKSAADPLVSYYASRLISQITVEALKACTQVKENPRH